MWSPGLPPFLILADTEMMIVKIKKAVRGVMMIKLPAMM